MLSTSNGPQVGARSTSPFTPLTRQSSIYSLTLEELQNAIDPSKHFGSMNMDEFLRNVWTAEESQAMVAALSSTTESNAAEPSVGLQRQSSLPHPGSLSLSRTLSRKTVDEVWRDIHRGPELNTTEQQKQANYGEMTLEAFLVKAGVVREEAEGESPETNNTSNFTGPFPTPLASSYPGLGPVAPTTHQATLEALAQNQQQQQQEWRNYQFKTATMQQQQHMLQQQVHEAAAAAYATAKRGGPSVALTMPGTPSGSGLEGSSDGGLGQVNGLSPAITTPDTPTRGKKRGPEVVAEKTVERRQRRMIKNRESAARSRARKQAYTVELEAEVTQLKEENIRLKKQAEDAEKNRKQMLESLKAVPQLPVKTPVLRRTRTNPW